MPHIWLSAETIGAMANIGNIIAKAKEIMIIFFILFSLL